MNSDITFDSICFGCDLTFNMTEKKHTEPTSVIYSVRLKRRDYYNLSKSKGFLGLDLDLIAFIEK